MKRSSGFSLLELVVTIAVFGVFLLILVSLEREVVHLDRRVRLQLLTHPEAEAVTSRVRRDVLDATGYPVSFGPYTQSSESLLLSHTPTGVSGEEATIVYLFGRNETRRVVYEGGTAVSSWVAKGIPAYQVTSYELPDGAVAVRLQARDLKGGLIVDQILEPRMHP